MNNNRNNMMRAELVSCPETLLYYENIIENAGKFEKVLTEVSLKLDTPI